MVKRSLRDGATTLFPIPRLIRKRSEAARHIHREVQERLRSLRNDGVLNVFAVCETSGRREYRIMMRRSALDWVFVSMPNAIHGQVGFSTDFSGNATSRELRQFQ